MYRFDGVYIVMKRVIRDAAHATGLRAGQSSTNSCLHTVSSVHRITVLEMA